MTHELPSFPLLVSFYTKPRRNNNNSQRKCDNFQNILVTKAEITLSLSLWVKCLQSIYFPSQYLCCVQLLLPVCRSLFCEPAKRQKIRSTNWSRDTLTFFDWPMTRDRSERKPPRVRWTITMCRIWVYLCRLSRPVVNTDDYHVGWLAGHFADQTGVALAY